MRALVVFVIGLCVGFVLAQKPRQIQPSYAAQAMSAKHNITQWTRIN